MERAPDPLGLRHQATRGAQQLQQGLEGEGVGEAGCLAGTQAHQPGHPAPLAALACGTGVLLDCSPLPSAQAAKDTHIHLCLSSRSQLQQSVHAAEKGVGNAGLNNASILHGMDAGTMLPGVTNLSLVLWHQPRSQILVPMLLQSASTSCRLTEGGSPHRAFC